MPYLPHAEDRVLIHNPYTPKDSSEYNEELDYYYGDEFQVKYGGVVRRIRAGETRGYPRYIALHIAKHLADHMLQAKGKTVNDQKDRPAVLKTILIGVEDYFYGELTQEKINEIVNVERIATDQEVDSLKLLEVDSGSPLGDIAKTSPKPLEDLLKAAEADEVEPTGETSLFDDSKPLPSKAELIKTAHGMSIELTGTETKEEIVSKIKAF